MPAQAGIRSFGFPERIEKAADPTARIPARAETTPPERIPWLCKSGGLLVRLRQYVNIRKMFTI